MREMVGCVYWEGGKAEMGAGPLVFQNVANLPSNVFRKDQGEQRKFRGASSTGVL
jgi:hypothetical protein